MNGAKIGVGVSEVVTSVCGLIMIPLGVVIQYGLLKHIAAPAWLWYASITQYILLVVALLIGIVAGIIATVIAMLSED